MPLDPTDLRNWKRTAPYHFAPDWQDHAAMNNTLYKNMEKLRQFIKMGFDAAVEFGAVATIGDVLTIEADSERASMSGELSINRITVFLQVCAAHYGAIGVDESGDGRLAVSKRSGAPIASLDNRPDELARWQDREDGRQEMIKNRRKKRYKK